MKKVEMAHVVKAHLEVRGCPVLTSNQCHSIAVNINDQIAAAPQPPALGGDLEVKRWEPRNTALGYDMQPREDGSFVLFDAYAVHGARLQAEVERLRGVVGQAHMALIGYLPGHRNDVTDSAIAACGAALAEGAKSDPQGCNECTHPECGRYEGPQKVECRAMADNACARPTAEGAKS